VTTDDEPHDWQVLDFLARYAADVESAAPGNLMHYLHLFPGREEAVAREFLRLTAAPPRASDDGTGEPGAGDDTIGPYRVLGEIGRGGQGVVYLAEDTRLGRTVALKVLARTVGTTSAIERFRREAVLSSRLEHPGICLVYDTGQDGDLHYIAMRYVPGESLATKLAGGALDHDDVLSWIESAARALHAAHQAGVVHRDVKPGNIMITPDGDVVLLDFGLARESDTEGPDLTVTGDVFGTLAYMSPEQLIDPGSVDRGTDVWSLTVVLFQCLTGRRPFEAPTRAGLQKQICEEPPATPREWRALPRDLRVITEVGLDRDRSRRYLSAEDFAEDLRRVREKQPIRARRPGPILRARRWVQRNAVLAASLAVGFGFLVAAVFYVNGQREDAVTRSERLRSLSLGLLSEVHAEVADLPGATSATRQIAQRALSVLQVIADQPTGDPIEYRRNLVLAHLQVGNVLGNRYHPNLGEPEKALVHYRAALGLLDELPNDTRTNRLRAECRMLMGQMHAQAGRTSAARKAYDASLALLANDPGTELEAELRLHRARVLRYEGTTGNRTAESLAELDRSQAIVGKLVLAQSHPPARLLTLEIDVLVQRSATQLGCGRWAEGRTGYEEAKKLLDALPAAARTGLRARLALARVDQGLAWLARDRGETRAGLALLESALSILENLRSADPENELVLDELLRARATEGLILISLERPDEAMAAFEAIKKAATEDATRLGSDSSLEHRTAAELGFGYVYTAQMKWQAAIRQFEAAKKLCEPRAAQPDAAVAKAMLAGAELYLGRALVRAGRIPQAHAMLKSADTRFTALAATDPDNFEFFVAKKIVCQQLAEVNFGMGRFDAAAEWYQKAIATHRARKLEPSTRSQRSLGVLLQGFANSLYQATVRAEPSEREKMFAEIAAAFRESRDLFAVLAENDAGDASNVRLLAEADIGLGRVERRLHGPEQALQHAEHAVTTMERALAKAEKPQVRQQLALTKALILKCLFLDELEREPEAKKACERALGTLGAVPRSQRAIQSYWLTTLRRLRSRLRLQ